MSFHMRDYVKSILIKKIKNIYSENTYKTIYIDSKPFFPNYLDNNSNIPLNECYSCAIFKKINNKIICVISVVMDNNYNIYMKSGPNINNTKNITPFSCLDGTNINSNIQKLFWFNNTNIINYINNMINISNNDIDTLDLFINDTLLAWESSMTSNIPINQSPVQQDNYDVPLLEPEPAPSPEPPSEPAPENVSESTPSLVNSPDLSEPASEDPYYDMPLLLDEYEQPIDPEGLKGPIYNKYYKNHVDSNLFTTNKFKKKRFNTKDDALLEAQQLINNNHYNNLCLTKDWKGWSIRTGPIWVNSSNKQKKINNLDLTHITYQVLV